MDVTIQLANQVLRLGREGHNLTQMADSVGVPEAAIMEALRMLGMPLPGVHAIPHQGLTDQERAAIHDKLPKRMQDRLDRIAKAEK